MSSKLSLRIGAASAAALMSFVGAKEGVSYVTYLDYGGIPTACFGETHGIKVGMTFTQGECTQMLADRLDQVSSDVIKCTRKDLPPAALAAYTSFAYNVGTNSFCNSTMARYARVADYQKSCAQFARWTYIGGKDCRDRSNLCYGIVIRRQEEQALCEGHHE